MLCSVCPIQVVWRIDCPLDTHRSIDFLTEMCAPGRGEKGRTRKAALLRLIWIFVSLCKSSLLIGGAFFLARRPSIPIFFSFSLLMPLLCSYTSSATTRVCSSLSLHTWVAARGRRGAGGERGSEKNFRKTNCWKKKEMISRKRVYTTTTMEARAGEKKRTWKKKSFYPVRTMNTQTFLKREICRWNKLLERWALTTSAKRRKKTKKRCAGGSVRKSIDSGHGKNDFTWKNVLAVSTD